MKLLKAFSLLILLFACSAVAESDFYVPVKLRPRVNFWIDIFTKYGKNQAVVHHRDFPQAVFGVLDFSEEAERMNAVVLSKHIDKEKKAEVKKVSAVLKRFAAGSEPQNSYEQRIYKAMELVPGGNSKFNDAVKDDLVRTQTGIKEKYRLAMERSTRYLPIIERIFKDEFNLPVELTRLPFVESSFDYQAYSSVGAAGIWQFMPKTAKSYKLTVNALVDERRDVISATRAAAKYMSDAYESLGKWPLAVTSYNHGVTGVYRKTKEAGSTNLADIIEDPRKRYFGFASSNFYPEFLAALEVYKNKEDYFPGIQMETPLKIKEHRLQSAASVQHVASRLQISPEELQNYNYALAKTIWNGRYKIPAGYNLKVPVEASHHLVALGAPEPSSGSSSVVLGVGTYKVRSGDTLSSIAASHGLTISAIRELNDIKGSFIKVGQTLIVNPNNSGPKEQKKKMPVAVTGNRNYTVAKGDSLWTISKAHNISVDKLKKINNLKNANIKPGQVIRVE